MQEPVRQISKPAKKFIQIRPAFLQAVLNDAGLLTATSMADVQARSSDFVNPGESVWGSGDASDSEKKFKLRLNSKKSGKKLDINLKFKIISDLGEQ